MRLAVTGKIKKKDAREIKDAARFFLKHLFKPKPEFLSQLSFTIYFSDQIKWRAECEWRDRPCRPKKYKITIKNDGTKKGRLMNLAHELTHAKQFANGELMDILTEPNKVFWKKKKHIFSDYAEDYWLAPWEIEARGYEGGLWKLYTSHKQDEARIARKKKCHS